MTSKLTGEGDGEGDVKKTIAFFGYKQRLLSIDIKTKVVQHVSRIKLDNLTTRQLVFKFSITFKLWNSWFPAFV